MFYPPDSGSGHFLYGSPQFRVLFKSPFYCRMQPLCWWSVFSVWMHMFGAGWGSGKLRVNMCAGIRAEFGRMTFSLWLCKDHPPNPPYHSRDFTPHVGIKHKIVPSPTPAENWTKGTWSTVLFYMLSCQVTPSWHHNLSLSLFLGVWVTRQCTQRQDWVIGLLASLKFDKPLCFFAKQTS